MHNLKTNFEKIRRICKSVLSKYLYADGNLEHYRNKPRMSDVDIIALSLTAEALGINSENHLYGKIKSDYPRYFSNLPDRPNYNRRKRRMQKYIPWVSESIARIIDPEADRYILDSVPAPVCHLQGGSDGASEPGIPCLPPAALLRFQDAAGHFPAAGSLSISASRRLTYTMSITCNG